MNAMVRSDNTRLNTLKHILELSGKPVLFLLTSCLIIIFIIPQLSKILLQRIKALISLLFSITTHPLSFLSVKLIIFAILIFFSYSAILKDLPSPTILATRTPKQSTKILDRNGKLLYKIYKDENRTLVHLNDLPKHLINATISAEDKTFYQHRGISLSGIIRAAQHNAKNSTTQGGSTITQQLIKNTLLTPERTLRRKIKEIILAIQTERLYSKDEILQMYLNEVSYGGTAYGIEEASQQYFGKPANALTLAESALLAGLPVAPTTNSPFGTSPYKAKLRQIQVLERMIEDSYITTEQKNIALKEKITLNPQGISIQAPHFVMFVKEYLATHYSDELINHGGLKITTTLDLEIQEMLDAEIENELQKLKHLKVGNAAGLVINPKTGEILAMAGSRDYFDFENDGQVNVTIQPRQPGSAIKPITYALAFSSGLTPSTTIVDEPIMFQIPGQKPYTPSNYDNSFHGKITLRRALASSYNIPAIRLLNSLGVNNMIKLAKDLGITTWDNPERFGLSLTLGGGEVTMLDLAQVYSTFANNGMKVNINPILEIKNHDDLVLEQNKCDSDCPQTRVLSPMVAFQINSILSDNNARAPAFGFRSVLVIPKFKVAVKTGTSNNLRDNWTIGYTKDLLVAIWVGNNDNTPMSQVASGITGASPIWNKVTTKLLSQHNSTHTAFVPPSDMIKLKICKDYNTKYCSSCPSRGIYEYYIPGTEPKVACQNKQDDQIQEGVQTKNSLDNDNPTTVDKTGLIRSNRENPTLTRVLHLTTNPQ